ncbi:MAG: hypothetical protein [Anelloviridae sp.]|nr:MAG: hypothetical protein [Anelloviridae sp.]
MAFLAKTLSTECQNNQKMLQSILTHTKGLDIFHPQTKPSKGKKKTSISSKRDRRPPKRAIKKSSKKRKYSSSSQSSTSNSTCSSQSSSDSESNSDSFSTKCSKPRPICT